MLSCVVYLCVCLCPCIYIFNFIMVCTCNFYFHEYKKKKKKKKKKILKDIRVKIFNISRNTECEIFFLRLEKVVLATFFSHVTGGDGRERSSRELQKGMYTLLYR